MQSTFFLIFATSLELVKSQYDSQPVYDSFGLGYYHQCKEEEEGNHRPETIDCGVYYLCQCGRHRCEWHKTYCKTNYVYNPNREQHSDHVHYCSIDMENPCERGEPTKDWIWGRIAYIPEACKTLVEERFRETLYIPPEDGNRNVYHSCAVEVGSWLVTIRHVCQFGYGVNFTEPMVTEPHSKLCWKGLEN